MWQGCSYLKSSGLFYFLPGPLHPQQMTVSGVSTHSHYFHVHGCQIKWPSWWNVWSQPPDGGPCRCAVPKCKGPMGAKALDSSPACHLGPWPRGCCPVALIWNILWGYMWLWWKNWRQYPHPLTLGWPPLLKICHEMLELDSPKQWWQAQVGQLFSTGDVQWGGLDCRWG